MAGSRKNLCTSDAHSRCGRSKGCLRWVEWQRKREVGYWALGGKRLVVSGELDISTTSSLWGSLGPQARSIKVAFHAPSAQVWYNLSHCTETGLLKTLPASGRPGLRNN
jgi:hypothetical protein